MTSESTDGYSPTLRSAPGRPYWVGGGLAVALGAWLTLPVWGPWPPGGDDVAAHVVRADFAFDHIFGQGRLDGWFPRFMVGHQEFLFYGPGFTWVIGLIRLLTFGALSTAGAVKVAGVAGFVGIAPAVMFLGRGLGLRAPAAAAAGVLALAVNNPFGVGLHAIYVIGLLPHQVAAVLFCVAIGAAARLVRDRGGAMVVVAGVALAGLGVTHVITAGIAVVFLVGILVTQLARGGRAAGWWRRLAGAGALALGLTAFWTIPAVAHRGLRGPVAAWSTPALSERAADIIAGRILFPAGLGVLVVGGLLGVIWLAPRHAGLALVPVVYLVGAHALIGAVPAHPVAIQLPNRGLGYAGLVALLPVGIALDRLTERAAASRLGRRDLAATATVLVACIGAFVFSLPARDAVGERGAPSPELVETAAELTRRVEPGDRFATERDFPAEIRRAGFTHPDLWLAEMSGRDTLNVFNPESSPSRAGFVSERIGRRPAEQLASSLGRYGVSHVVTMRRSTALELAVAPSYRPVWQRGDFGIFAVEVPGRLGPLHGAGLTGSVDVAEPGHIVAVVRSPEGGRLTAALSWSPKWAVTVDGDAVPTRPAADGVVEFPVPRGRSEVELRFRRDRFDAAGSAVTLAALALVAYLALSVSMSSLMSRRRSRTA